MSDTPIPSPVGSTFVQVPELPPIAPGVGVRAQPDGPAVPFTDAALKGAIGVGAATQAREARAMQPDSTVLEGLGAAVASWDTTRLVQRLARPSFENDTPINQMDYLNQVPKVLTEDERDYFLSVGKGVQSAAYAMEQIDNRRMAQRVVGDHPVAGFIGAFADPVWLAVPPAIRFGKTSQVAGRVVSGVSGAAIAGGVAAAGEGPIADQDIALNMMLNGAAAAVLYKPGKGLVAADPSFPSDTLTKAATDLKPRYKLVDGKPVLMAPELQPQAVNTDAAKVVAAVDTALSQSTKERGLGSKLMWNMHKTMQGFGDVGKRVADMLYDNNADLSITSMEAHREMILSGLRAPQGEFEALLRQQMAVEGAGLGRMLNPGTSREAYKVQQKIEREVQRELFRREQMARNGLPVQSPDVPAHITQMADKLDALHALALKEMKAAGVEGAENLLERPGYLNRKWSSVAIDAALDRMEASGLTREAGQAQLKKLVALSLRRVNLMDQRLAEQVGSSIIDRALRKGYFEDGVFNAPAGAGQLKELRDILKEGGLEHADIERALNVLRVQSDDAGKQGFMKHRMDLDYKATVRVGNDEFSIMDLIDSRVSTIVDQYAQRVSTTSAMSRKGLRKPSDVEALREELLKSIPDEQMRAEAKELFDNTIAHLRGDPAGARVPEQFRLLQSYTRAISLAWSGLWQATEYANAMGEYGLLKTMKYASQELPGFKQMLRGDKADMRSLDVVLADHSTSSLRLRPFLARFEDGYEMDMGNAMQLSSQTMGQLVPMANAMKYVHHHQAKMTGNLILDRVRMAAAGNAKAREALAKHGIEAPVMDKLAEQVKQHGFNVDAWDDAVWMQVRPAFGKMMDATVLRNRLGDMPAFAAFDQVGKFIFTYRSFVLAAHNKVLAGGLERNGAGAVGLVLLYQFPLALAAVQAQSVIMGGKPQTQEELVKKALGQMGGLGLFSEPLKWATGESNSIGAPGLIALDRGVKLFQAGTNLDANAGGSAALSMIPVVSAIPFVKGMANQIKEK